MQIYKLAGMLLIAIAAIGGVAAQKDPYFKGNRTTIVHLFEWTWSAIAKECEDFLGPRGFGGVQISPPNECRIIPSRPWWERYQPISYLLTSRSGTESELVDMITRCNRAGVRIYVDAVINHMSGFDVGESHGTAGSIANFAAQSFPAVPYGPEDFNTACDISNYHNNKQVRNCRLNILLDLKHSRPNVREAIAKYMNKLIDMGVAGFRIDASKHMWPEDLRAIYAKLHKLKREAGFPSGAHPFIYQEVIDIHPEAVSKNEYTQFGAVTEFKHSSEIGRAFHGRNQLKWLRNWGPEWNFLQSLDAIIFVDNHDNQREKNSEILKYKDGESYKMALIFMLAHPYGRVTRLMSSFAFNSTDQGPPATGIDDDLKITSPTFLPTGECNTADSGWVCEHRWPAVANMVEFRNIVSDSCVENWWDNGNNQIAFARGRHGFVAINLEPEHEMNTILQTNLLIGNYCDIISGAKTGGDIESCSGTMFTVASDGSMKVHLPKGPSAMVVHIDSRLADVI